MKTRTGIILWIGNAAFCVAAMGQLTKSSAAKDNLQAYTDCQFGDKIVVAEAAERTSPFLRPVGTRTGTENVTIVHGFSLHIAYDTTPFVNFKAERIADSDYAHDKKVLIDNLANAAAGTPDMESLQPKAASLNGFELYSIERKKLAGGVLSIYLLFRDIDKTAVTLYFLNTPPESPKFTAIEEARKLRDGFLQTYTRCVQNNLVH